MTARTRKHPTKGFAGMSKEQRQAIAAMGGRQAQANGTAHRWSVEEAKHYGQVGGQANAARFQKLERES